MFLLFICTFISLPGGLHSTVLYIYIQVAKDSKEKKITKETSIETQLLLKYRLCRPTFKDHH